MSALMSVQDSFELFYDSNRNLLDNGYIYIGTAGTNPELTSNQLALYSDGAETVSLAQPVRTLNGYPVDNNGKPINIHISASDHSITIRDKNKLLTYTNLNFTKLYSSATVTYLPDTNGASITNVQTKLRESISVEDFGAVGDGVIDDSAAFNTALVAITNGGTLELDGTKTYKIDNPITGLINALGFNMTNVWLKGNGATLNMTGLNDVCLQIGRDTGGEATAVRCERIQVTNLRIRGSGSSSSDTSQTAIKMLSVIGVVLRDVYMDNIGGDAIVIDKPALALDGTAFSNGVVLDNVRTRFIGRRCLVVGEGVVTDDITIIGNCMFNNGGTSLTADGASDTGGVHIETQTIMWYGGEVSGMGNDAGTFGYPNTVYLRSCAGVMNGVHFELNGVRASNGFYDLTLDTDCHGMVVSGLEFNEEVSTNVQYGIKSTSDNVTITGLQFVGTRSPEILVNINNTTSNYVSGIFAQTAPATARVNVNDPAKTAVIHDSYLTIPEDNASTTGGNVGSFTWTSGSGHTISNDQVTALTKVILFPANASAGTLVGGSKSPYISAKVAGTSFSVATADASAVAGGEIFNYMMFN